MINIKSREDLDIIRRGSKILANIIHSVAKRAVPGITTLELNNLAEDLILDCGGSPSFKGYSGFPASICASLNEEVVHGVPSDRLLIEGDILTIDIGMFYDGFHSDMAVTVPVGKINPEAARLIKSAKKALKRGLKKVRPGNTFGDIGNTIERYVRSQGFFIVDGLCGHGIGRELHEEPEVHNIGKRRSGPEMREGMVFCIEPMISAGGSEIERTENGITFRMKDRSLSAHFEHTVAVTAKGVEVLTELERVV